MKFLFDHDVPEDLSFALKALGHEVLKLRELLPITTRDDEVLRFANEQRCLLVTCNRDDFIAAAQHIPHQGMIILVRRKSRAAERAALVRLLDTAGETELCRNINFA